MRNAGMTGLHCHISASLAISHGFSLSHTGGTSLVRCTPAPWDQCAFSDWLGSKGWNVRTEADWCSRLLEQSRQEQPEDGVGEPKNISL